MRWRSICPTCIPISAGTSTRSDIQAVSACQASTRSRPAGQRHRGDGEGKAQRLDQLVLLEADRLQVGDGGNHEHAGRAGDEARRQADQRRQPDLVPPRHREPQAGQAHDSIDRERDAKAEAREPRRVAGENARAGDRAQHHAQHHGPQSPGERGEAWPGQQLPDIGDQRRHDQQRGGFGGRQDDRQQAHRHGRQAHADHALDEAGEQEDRGGQRPDVRCHADEGDRRAGTSQCGRPEVSLRLGRRHIIP